MKILQTNFHHGWGGQPARILMTSRAIADLGHEVVIAAPAGSSLAERARAAGLSTFEALAFRKPKHVAAAVHDVARLARHLRRERYDLVDAHGSQDLWTCVLARAISGSPPPLVFTRHNTKRVRGHAANRWLYRRIDHLILASGTVRQRYEPLLRAGVLRPERLSVVHSAYRTDRFHPGVDGGRLRAELGLQTATPLVGVVGRLVPDKGQDDFLRAAAEVLSRRADTRFVLVGTGTAEPALRALAAALGIADRVRFLGFRDDVPEITAALTISVLPSVDCDASSAVLKEALACGVPAVATDIGGASEILRPGETGLIVPPHDPPRLAQAILALLDDPERARAMGRQGSRDVAGRFTARRLAEETIAVYTQVLARRPR
ncbi:MAG TPA: glycosyltransferase family 4 protein [Candidatus Polarisedimenticolia bacterium]|nr:glycosyltransferase family 4 protein [Candidatus Polarisedimenticolia bacterium]